MSDLLPVPAPEAFDLDNEIVAWEKPHDAVRAPWLPRSQNDAEWAAMKLAEAAAAYDEVDAEVEEYERRVKAWAEARRAPLRRAVEFFRDRLQVYGVIERERGAHNGWLRLPSATIKTREHKTPATKAALEVLDAEVLQDWAHENADECVAIVVSVDMAKLHERITIEGDDEEGWTVIDRTTGELVPGVRWVPASGGEVDGYTATVKVER